VSNWSVNYRAGEPNGDEAEERFGDRGTGRALQPPWIHQQVNWRKGSDHLEGIVLSWWRMQDTVCPNKHRAEEGSFE